MKIEDILEQKEKMRKAIEKIVEIKNQAQWQGLITDNDFVFTEDTSKALSNEQYCFSIDSFGPIAKIDDIEQGRVGPKWFESMLTNGLLGNYNGEIRVKCNYDSNFKRNMKKNKINTIMHDSDVSFGYGDGIIEEINVGNFQFFIKIKPEVPFASDISYENGLIRFNDLDFLMTEEHYNKDKDKVVVNVFSPCIIDKAQQFNKWIKEGKV